MSDLQLTWLRRGNSGGTPVLRLEKLSVNVGIRKVIEDIDLEVEEGATLCLTGPNGSGKSTLLNAIAGLAPAVITAGRVVLFGREVTAMPAHARARLGLSLMRQRANVFPDLTIEENLRLALGVEGRRMMERVFPGWTAHLPAGKRASLLSGGQRQRLAWAMAALRPSKLLLADEPEAGLSEKLPLPEARTYIVASHSQNGFAEAAPIEEPQSHA